MTAAGERVLQHEKLCKENNGQSIWIFLRSKSLFLDVIRVACTLRVNFFLVQLFLLDGCVKYKLRLL